MKIELGITEELGKSLKEIAAGAKLELDDVIRLALSNYVTSQSPKPKPGLFGLSLPTIAVMLAKLGRFVQEASQQKKEG